MDHERAALESRYHALLALASDEATSWHGIAGERLTGDWSGYSRREARLTSERDQARMFGRVLVPHDGRLDTLEGDGQAVEVPGTRPCHLPAGPDTPDSPAAGGHASQSGETDQPDDGCSQELQLLNSIKLIVLGSLPNGSVKVFSLDRKRTEIIRDVAQLRYPNLLRIAGASVKEFVARPGDENPSQDQAPMSAVVDAMGLLAGKTIIEEQTELGLGIWEGKIEEPDGSRAVVLVGEGEGAYWNGDRKLHRLEKPNEKGHLLDFKSDGQHWYDFAQLRDLLDGLDQEKSIAIANQAIELFSRWRWKNETAPEIVTGLVFATWVQALWEWRPMVALTGESNSGKSYLWGALEDIFGKLCVKTSKPTAAGIRQDIGNTSKPILLDEFEQDNHRDEILDMLRASSRGDKILRGTANQKGIKFRIRHIVWVAAIEAGLQREPDKNRFIGLDLVKPPEELHGKLTLPSKLELNLLGQGMLAVAIQSIGRAKKLAVSLRDTKVQGIDPRIVESFAVPAAMLAAIRGFSDQEARDLLELYLRSLDLDEVEVEIDRDAVLREMMSTDLYHDRQTMTVGQWIEQHLREPGKIQESADALGSAGIKLDYYTDQEILKGKFGTEVGNRCFIVSHKTVQKKLFDNKKRGIEKHLSRIPDVIRSRRRVGKILLPCCLIPMTYMQQHILGQDQRELPSQPDAY